MDKPSDTFYSHSTARRVNTDAVVIQAIRAEHPEQNITSVIDYTCNLLGYAAAGNATAIPLDSFKGEKTTSLTWRLYAPPAKRLDSSTGGLVDVVQYAKYIYTWEGHDFILYYVNGRDGDGPYPQQVIQYVIGDEKAINELILVAGKYTTTLHDEIWVFDKGYWQTDKSLWKSIQNSLWENVILPEAMKAEIRDDVQRFFDSRGEYEKLGVPWKRGVIFYGPPGNGKTISIKATMHMLYDRMESVPTLYVKTLASFAPPEFSLGSIFSKARQEAPCYLVFEDLDSVVSDNVRSFFLNEVDGLNNNDGILMVGSTNHLELLDPGISKRPSRFDRKYLFPDPDEGQRVKYCHYWQGKLKHNKDIKFPDSLCKAIAKITDGFSFAYIQEAFVAALLVIAGSKGNGSEESTGGLNDEWELIEDENAKIEKLVTFCNACDIHDEPELRNNVLWVEIKKQIDLLRKEITNSAE